MTSICLHMVKNNKYGKIYTVYYLYLGNEYILKYIHEICEMKEDTHCEGKFTRFIINKYSNG